jgi:hypothetical protein
VAHIVKVRTVAIHAVDALDRDPRPPARAGRTPFLQSCIERSDIVVRDGLPFGATAPHALVHAGMNEFIVQDKVVPLRERGEYREIGSVAGAEIECALCSEICRRLSFQRLVLLVITAQQSRSAGPDRHAARDRVRRRSPQFVRFRKSEIVIRAEIDARPRAKRTQPTLVVKSA